MLPNIQFLIAIVIAQVFLKGGDPPLIHHSVWTPVGTWLSILLVIPPWGWLRRRLESRLDGTRGDFLAMENTLLQAYYLMGWFRWIPILLFFAMCWLFGWPAYVASGPLDGTILLDEMAALAPFLAALVLTWHQQFRMELLLSGRDIRLAPYLGFQFRQTLLFILPVLGLLLFMDVLEASPGVLLYFVVYPFLHFLLVGVVLTVLFLFSGPLIQVIFRTSRLPEGSVRDRLVQVAHRLDFKFRDLLIWRTGLNILNAAIIGGLARLRYVLFTRGMLNSFTDEEIEAVFAHEVGHARGRHMHFYFVFALSLLFLYLLAYEALQVVLSPEVMNDILVEVGFFVFVLVVYWQVVFGFVSRKFEREADYFASRAIGDHRLFIQALEEVARKSGILRKLPSRQHHSIASRVAFLEIAFADPGKAHRFLRSVRWVKVALILILIGSMVLAMRDAAFHYRAGTAILEAVDSVQTGDYQQAKASIRRYRLGRGQASEVAAVFGDLVGDVEKPGPDSLDALLLVDFLVLYGSSEWAHEVFEHVIRRGEVMLRQGDLDGAADVLRRVLKYRRSWDDAIDLKLSAFRLSLRQETESNNDP